MGSDLKPCPFCGALPAEHEHRGVWRMHHLIHCRTTGCPATPGVGNSGPAHYTFPTKDEAVAVWNRRAALSRPAGGAPVWMVRNRATGKIWIDEVCVWPDEMSARECAEDMNENIDDANFEAVAMLAAAAPTPPSGEDSRDAERLDFVMRHVRRSELRRIGIYANGGDRRPAIDAAIAASREVGDEN